MRFAFLILGLCVGTILLALAGPRFVASLARGPGNQAIALASVGAELHRRSYERAVRSLEAATAIRDHQRDYIDLVIVRENFGRQQVANVPLRERLYAAALAAFEESTRYSVVEPTGWLLVAQMRYELGDRQGAAEALAWSLRTSIYRRQHAMPRAFLALAVWDLLDEAVRTQLVYSIATTVDEAPVEFAAWTVELDLVHDIADRLARHAQDGEALAERFRIAAEDHRRERQAAARDAAERAAAMRNMLAASALLVTASLPSFGEAMTIADYMVMRDDALDPAAEERLSHYLVGVLDGLIMLGSLNREAGDPLFCMPERDAVEIDIPSFRRDLDAMLEQLERDVPGFAEFARTRTLGLAALQLLTLQHPCDG
jgi:hypothetical protein